MGFHKSFQTNDSFRKTFSFYAWKSAYVYWKKETNICVNNSIFVCVSRLILLRMFIFIKKYTFVIRSSKYDLWKRAWQFGRSQWWLRMQFNRTILPKSLFGLSEHFYFSVCCKVSYYSLRGTAPILKEETMIHMVRPLWLLEISHFVLLTVCNVDLMKSVGLHAIPQMYCCISKWIWPTHQSKQI